MNVLELAKAAIDTLNDAPKEIEPNIVLKMPGRWGISRKKYLAGPKSPQGDIVKEDHEGVYVVFDAMDILIWCAANGAPIVIERQSS